MSFWQSLYITVLLNGIMPTLIACLSTGKGTWLEVSKILKSRDWNKVFLITNQFGKENFNPLSDNVNLVVIDTLKETDDLVEDIKKGLKNQFNDFEIALNLASGSGKEHMALLEAVLELGCNFRLVTLKKEQYNILGLKA